MIWIFVISALVFLNVLLLKFSCNNCDISETRRKPRLNMPEKNDLITQPVMADK